MKIECLQTLTAEDDNKQRSREQNFWMIYHLTCLLEL